MARHPGTGLRARRGSGCCGGHIRSVLPFVSGVLQEGGHHPVADGETHYEWPAIRSSPKASEGWPPSSQCASGSSQWKRAALGHVGCRIAEHLVGARRAVSECLDDEQAVRPVAHWHRAGEGAEPAFPRAARPLIGGLEQRLLIPQCGDTAARSDDVDGCGDGTRGLGVVVPLPNCPRLLIPQHLTAPSAVSAHDIAP